MRYAELRLLSLGLTVAALTARVDVRIQSSRTSESVRAGEFLLTDANGAVTASLNSDKQGMPRFALFDKTGIPRFDAGLTSDGSPEVVLRTLQGQPAVRVASPNSGSGRVELLGA